MPKTSKCGPLMYCRNPHAAHAYISRNTGARLAAAISWYRAAKPQRAGAYQRRQVSSALQRISRREIVIQAYPRSVSSLAKHQHAISATQCPASRPTAMLSFDALARGCRRRRTRLLIARVGELLAKEMPRRAPTNAANHRVNNLRRRRRGNETSRNM